VPNLSAEPLDWPTDEPLGYAGAVALVGKSRHSGPKVEWERIPVAAVCDVCGKRPGFGHNVPWSKKKTNRRWNPNIQRVRAAVSGQPKRLNVCTSCIKAGKVSR
jgi:large subunit ribosomal protein L28